MYCGVVLRMVKKRWWWWWWWWCPFLHGCFCTFHHLECPYPPILHQNHYCLPIKSQFKLRSLRQAGVRCTFSDRPSTFIVYFHQWLGFSCPPPSSQPTREEKRSQIVCFLKTGSVSYGFWYLHLCNIAFIVHSISICWNNILLGIELETRIQNGSFIK